MSTTHSAFTTTTGTNPKKFEEVPAFKEPGRLFKFVAGGFRKAGRISDFINRHAIKTKVIHSGWNGYGYTEHNYCYLLRPKDAKTLVAMLEEHEAERVKKQKTPEEKKEAWARQLVRYTNICEEDALEIADEKLAAKKARIDELYRRQFRERYSSRREKLIGKLERANPLRRIENEEHAFRILAASVRHNHSNYDDMLEEAKNKAGWGEISYDEVRSYARQHAQYWGDVQSVFFGEEEEKEGDDDS